MAVRTIIAGVCDTLKRYSIVRELKRRAGSGTLRRPPLTLIIDIYSPFLLWRVVDACKSVCFAPCPPHIQ